MIRLTLFKNNLYFSCCHTESGGNPSGKGKTEFFPLPTCNCGLNTRHYVTLPPQTLKFFLRGQRPRFRFAKPKKFAPTPLSPLPLPFPEVSAPFCLKAALAPRVVIGFSLLRIRIARHLNKCTLTLVGAQFVGSFRKPWRFRRSLK